MSSTDWQDQVSSMMNAWAKAQQSLWESWMGLAAPASPAPYSSELVERWQHLAQQSLDAWTRDAAPIARSTAEQFLAAQNMVLRFIEFSARASEAVAPKLEQGQDWQGALNQVMDQLRQQWSQIPADVTGTAQDTAKLAQLYMDQWQSFGQPWEAVFRQSPAYWSQAAAGKGESLAQISNLFRDAYNQTFGRLAGSPNLGLMRELSQKMQQGFDAWVAWHLANLEYQGVLAEIWDRAFEQFRQDIVSLAEKDEKINSVRELILLWTRGAEQVFTEAFREEKYVMAQGKLLAASMSQRLREREIVEVWLRMYDLPTRTELDEAHRRIYELRKEVKALKRVLAELAPSAAVGEKSEV